MKAYKKNTTMNSKKDSEIWPLLFAAWMVALISTLGALFIGEIMGQAPCVLCWYQRAFMFPLAAILGVAAYRTDEKIWHYGLPLAGLGWLVASYHALLYADVIPAPIVPCGAGPSCSGEGMTILGFVPIPLLSVLSFTLITGLLLAIRRRSKS